jgi:hypothetical protein
MWTTCTICMTNEKLNIDARSCACVLVNADVYLLQPSTSNANARNTPPFPSYRAVVQSRVTPDQL